MLRKLSTIEKFAGAGAPARTVIVRISDDSVDRQGDIVVQSGIDTSSFFQTGGTVLWGHDPDQPIAKCLSITRQGSATQATVKFPEAGVSAKADEVYGLIKEEVINSSSVGFRSIKWEPVDPKEPWGGRRFLKTELMEFSFVSVPANAGATIIQRSRGSGDSALEKLKSALEKCEAHHGEALKTLKAVDEGEMTTTEAMTVLRKCVTKAKRHAGAAAQIAGELAEGPDASNDADTELSYGRAQRLAAVAAFRKRVKPRICQAQPEPLSFMREPIGSPRLPISTGRMWVKQCAKRERTRGRWEART